MSLVQEAENQANQSGNSSSGIVLDLSQHFDRGANLTADISGGAQASTASFAPKPLQISDAFWCERKNHMKKTTGGASQRKLNEGKQGSFSAAVQNFLDTTPCPMETMARNYLCVRFQVRFGNCVVALGQKQFDVSDYMIFKYLYFMYF